MRRSRTSLMVLLMLAVLISTLAGCGRKGLINVNGDKMSKEEFYARLEQVPVQTPSGTKMAGQYVIEQMISEKVIQQLAKDKGVAPTEAQITKKINLIKKESAGSVKNLQMEEIKRRLNIEQSLINVVTKGITVPDSEVRKAYDQALAMPNSPFKRPEQVRISVIVCENQAKSQKVWDMLQSGQDFGTVAMRMSADPYGRKNRGNYGWLSRNMPKIPKSVMDTAFSLPLGKYSQPIKVGAKEWDIVKAEQKRPARVQKYDDVKDLIREQLAIRQGSATNRFPRELERFTKKSKIVVNAERYKTIPDSIKKDATAALEAANKKLQEQNKGIAPKQP